MKRLLKFTVIFLLISTIIGCVHKVKVQSLDKTVMRIDTTFIYHYKVLYNYGEDDEVLKTIIKWDEKYKSGDIIKVTDY